MMSHCVFLLRHITSHWLTSNLCTSTPPQDGTHKRISTKPKPPVTAILADKTRKVYIDKVKHLELPSKQMEVRIKRDPKMMFGFFIGETPAPPRVTSITFKECCPGVQLGDMIIKINDLDAYHLPGSKARDMLMGTPEGYVATVVLGREERPVHAPAPGLVRAANAASARPATDVAAPAKEGVASAVLAAPAAPKPQEPLQSHNSERASEPAPPAKPARSSVNNRPARPPGPPTNKPARPPAPSTTSATSKSGADAAVTAPTEPKLQPARRPAPPAPAAAPAASDTQPAPPQKRSPSPSHPSADESSPPAEQPHPEPAPRPARRPTDYLKQNTAMSSLAAAMASGLNQRRLTSDSKDGRPRAGSPEHTSSDAESGSPDASPPKAAPRPKPRG